MAATKSLFAPSEATGKTKPVKKNAVTKPEEPTTPRAARPSAALKAVEAKGAKTGSSEPAPKGKVKLTPKKSAPVTKLPAQKTVTKNPAGAAGARAGAATVLADTKKPKKEAAEGGKRGRKSAFLETDKIRMLVKENPKREGSKAHGIFELLKKSKTVADFYAAGGGAANLTWNVNHGTITVGK